MKIKKYIFLLCLLVLGGCADQSVQIPDDKKADVSGYLYLSDEKNNFYKSSFKEAMQFMDEKKDALFYIGYFNCPWCQEAIPLLQEAAKETNTIIYSISLYDKDNQRTFDVEEQKAFVELAKDKLDKDDKDEPTLYVPYVFTLKDGVINKSHIATVTGHNAHEREMTVDEKQQLKQVYLEMMQ